jgi:hypothetical protein
MTPTCPTGSPTSAPTVLFTCIVVKIEIDKSFIPNVKLEGLLAKALVKAVPIFNNKVEIYVPSPQHQCGLSQQRLISLYGSTHQHYGLAVDPPTVVTFDVIASM